MTGQAARPRFSIVTAVYNVEPYLPEFIASVEAQRIEPGELEIVAVDDGSTDGSLALLQEWAGRSRSRVQVLSKPNGGQGSARNLGLEHASGEWVTFPDPDDLLDPDYLRVAANFEAAHPDVDLLTARPVLFQEGSGGRTTAHPRQWQFAKGNRVADLLDEPAVFLGVSPGSFFRRSRIEADALRFDNRIRPNFEDAHFAVRYVLGLAVPRIGLLNDSVYVYRKRAAGTSTMQGSMGHPGRYSDVLEHGYLDAMERGRRPDGSVAPWIQQLIIYELSWYLSEDERISSSVFLPDDLAPRFHELLDRVLRQLDPEVVAMDGARPLSSHWRDLLAHAARGVDWHSPYVVRTRLDREMGLRRVGYRFVGAAPEASFRANGETVTPAFTKTMAHRYYGRDFLFEQITWIPERPGLEVQLNDAPVPVLDEWPAAGTRRAKRRRGLRRRIAIYLRLPPSQVVPRLIKAVRRRYRRLIGAVLRRLARAAMFARFRDAWVLMDRIHDADDNGERLFEYLRASRPDVNAWFVIERGSPDWNRLRARGEKRLIAHDSFTWKMLMLNCSWLISSHVDLPISRPDQILRIERRPRWKLAFLQHGVIKDDLSRWLNNRDIDLFVVSTEPELESVAGDGTTYRFTRKETRNTGLPRFDRLLQTGRAVPPDSRDLVIVAPTWRHWLTLPLAKGSQRRELDDAFWESEYIQRWTGLLRSPAIADAIARRGWRLGFMPHPNLQSILEQLELPAHVVPLSFAGTDVQALYGKCAGLVTDYSSVAFNLAYLDRPVVYFQFDRAAMFGGAHVGRKGYFEYERDGFGPVVEDLAAAERAVVDMIEGGPQPDPEYQARIDRTFPVRDSQACARVVAAIEELGRPYAAPAP